MLWNAFDHANLARTLLCNGAYDAALTACRIGLHRRPDSAELLALRAHAYDGLGRPADAANGCERVLALEPAGPHALDATILSALLSFDAGDVESAFAAARRAWALAPDERDVHTLLGNLLSWHGDLAAALPHVEWNWTQELASCRERFGAEPWNGEDARDRRILVVHRQGYGDMIQMARYLPILRERVARVAVECAPPIAALMRRMPGVDEVAAPAALGAERYDAYVLLTTLPRILGPEAGVADPYIVPEPARVAKWTPHVAAAETRVGLVWGGNPAHPFDFARSIPPEQLAPLGDVPNVRFFSLMLEPEVDAGFDVVRIGEAFNDFEDAAAVIAQLDAIVTVDTAYAHLAGALGIPVWTLLHRRPDWRWSGSGDRTPWYRSMRLFRESEPGWPTAIARVASNLLDLCERR